MSGVNLPEVGTVQSYSALRRIPSLPTPDRTALFLQGRSGVADGGEGIFLWNPVANGDDDDATIIKPIDRTTAGRWVSVGGASNGERLMYYGDASDGDVQITGATGLTRDMHYNTLSFGPSGALDPDNAVIRCRTLDLRGAPAGAIATEVIVGLNASGTTGASAPSSSNVRPLQGRTLGGVLASAAGVAGGTGAGTAGNATTNQASVCKVSHAGVAGGTGSGGAGGAGGAVAGGTSDRYTNIRRLIPDPGIAIVSASNSNVQGLFTGGRPGSSGGGGGGDGTAGGGSGSGGLGGPPIFIFAQRILVDSTTTAGCIRSLGGAGGNGGVPAGGNRGGGGPGNGGGGGPIYIATEAVVGPQIANAVTATGGTGGNGGNGTGTGTGADGGRGGPGGVISIINSLTGQVIFYLDGADGTAGTAASGTTGGTGGAGGSCAAPLGNA